MSLWSLIKTGAALASIGILLEPALRRLGYLPPSDSEESPALGNKANHSAGTRTRGKTKSTAAVTDASARKHANGREQRHH